MVLDGERVGGVPGASSATLLQPLSASAVVLVAFGTSVQHATLPRQVLHVLGWRQHEQMPLAANRTSHNQRSSTRELQNQAAARVKTIP
jgi:hypothetical protein